MFSVFAVGSYTRRRTFFAEGEGISLLVLDEKAGVLRRVAGAGEMVNPAYLAYSLEGKFLLAAGEEEQNAGKVRSYRISGQLSKDGNVSDMQITPLSSAQGAGLSQCHVALDHVRKLVFTSSYQEGTLGVYTLDQGGTLRLIEQPVRYSGCGPHPTRQKSAHIHQAMISPDGRYLYTVDLGSDCIWEHELSRLRLNGREGNDQDSPFPLLPAKKVPLPSGVGPRHLAKLPGSEYLYLVCELQALICILRQDPVSGHLEILDKITYVSGKGGRASTQAPAAVKLHPSGKTLSISVRGSNTIVLFSVDAGGRRLVPLETFHCQGEGPRDIEFAPSGRWLLIGNMVSSSITLRAFDCQTGLPLPQWGQIFPVGTPTSILRIPEMVFS